ncbi:MAG: hypothetical protein JXR83_17465 [Deltaproteobacteria bacterium]|nr:hypothetical protein [Deltaproteobacteria bacterium]
MGNAEAWRAGFDQLPPEKQRAVRSWIDTQMFIARELGLEAEHWFTYVEWAFQHPFDFGFAGEGGLQAALVNRDAMVKDGKKKAADLVGAKPASKLPLTGAGKGNLLGMVVAGKKDREK